MLRKSFFEVKLIKFRRQYFLTQSPIQSLEAWQKESFDKYIVYAENSLGHYKAANKRIELLMLGYWIDPHNQDLDNSGILNRLLINISGLDSIFEHLYSLSGRFVLFVNLEGNLYVFNDASGFRPVFYTFQNDDLYISSNPYLFSLVIDLKTKKDQELYYKSDHYLQSPTYNWHAGYTFFEDVEHLIPNHYLNIKKRNTHRFFPLSSNQVLESNELLEQKIIQIAALLKNSLFSISKRGPVSFSLSAGNDSRVLLSLLKRVAPKVYFWISYNNKKEADYFVPQKILKDLELDFHPIRNRKPHKDFLKFYRGNTPMAHKFWARYNYSKIGNYPENVIVIRGASSETVRNYYYPTGNHPLFISIKSLQEIGNFSFLKLDFMQKDFSKWLLNTENYLIERNYNTLDFLFWEHRQGAWQAQNQLESDFLFDVFVPFNNREILNLMLSIPNKYRDKKEPYIYKRIIELNWPKLLQYPINPPSKDSKLELISQYYLKALKYKIKKHLYKI